MTYCLGLLLRDGLILMADTRTNAGVDNISTYAKLHVLADTDERLIVALTAGNLSVSQALLARLAEGLPAADAEEPPRRLADMPTMIYDAGNFIACAAETPYLQIGDTHYGKPILDRMTAWEMPLDEAVKVGLLSFDATLRSNLAVGLPIDLMAIPADAAQPAIRRRIEADDAYFRDLSARWSRLLNEARAAIPDPPFMPRG
jgi:putative proteasome-type protease